MMPRVSAAPSPPLPCPRACPGARCPKCPPSGTGMNAGEATGLLGGDASMTEANLALETEEGVDPTAEG